MMKLRGHISEIEVMVMVDSGANHCFINQTTIEKLGMPVTYAGRFGVRLSDGSRSLSTRTCPAVNVQLGSTQIQVDCFVIPLGTVDPNLGISWLATLGEVRSNWAESSMKFKQGKEWVTLLGDPTPVRLVVLVRALQKLCDVDFYVLRANDIYKFMTLLPKDYYLILDNSTKNLLRPNYMM